MTNHDESSSDESRERCEDPRRPTGGVGASPPESGSDAGDKDREPGVRGWRRRLLGGSLIASAVGLLPPALVCWFLVGVLGTFGVSKALSVTEGLDPLTYGGGFSMAVIGMFVAVAGGTVYRWVSDEDSSSGFVRFASRPSVSLFLLFVIPALAVIPVELNGIDLPDTVTTALLLGTEAYLLGMIPVVVVGLCWRLGRFVFRWASSSEFRAGVITGLASLFSLLLFATAFSPFLLAGEDASSEDSDDEEFEEIVEEGFTESEGPVDGSLALMTGFSKWEPEKSPLSVDEQQRFERCVETIVDDFDRNSPFERAVRRIRRRSNTPSHIAEDVVQLALLNTCEEHAETEVDEVMPYFNKVVRNTANDDYKSRKRHDYCGLQVESDSPLAPDYHRPPSNEVIDFKEGFCRLDDDNQQVLWMRGKGMEYDEISSRLGVKPATARKRVSRARKELKRQVN